MRDTLRNIDREYKKKLMSLLSEIPTLETLKINSFVTEEAVYNMSFRSNKAEAKLFTKWVTKALKQIRIHGYYIATEKDQEWLDIRTEGKKVRKDFTDEIQEFVY
ncbi:BRO family protein [Clostridioides difficile]|uniref:BRO family protein n=1 Tax=Clostridioides difficile TaxID=1496 RepID=UPI00265D44F3|nr:BRO family protein [Clostridioides difficile]